MYFIGSKCTIVYTNLWGRVYFVGSKSAIIYTKLGGRVYFIGSTFAIVYTNLWGRVYFIGSWGDRRLCLLKTDFLSYSYITRNQNRYIEYNYTYIHYELQFKGYIKTLQRP